MRPRIFGITVAVAALVAGSLAVTVSDAAPATGTVYLALGDSLAAGVQPTGDLRSGYAVQLFQLEQAAIPDLRLIDLGCPGERTSTIDRSRHACPFEAGSQLDQAVETLTARDVAFVTLQIGSNDVFHCFRFSSATFDDACVDEVLPKMGARLTSIVQTLRAASPDTPIVGSTYQDPLLWLWTVDGIPNETVTADAAVWDRMNTMLVQTYGALDVPVVDIAGAFSNGDLTTMVHVPRSGVVPLGVARICEWSFACTGAVGHDPHPNTIGYAVMARAWQAVVDAAIAP
jgi:lysophospholipase L1-like esterase